MSLRLLPSKRCPRNQQKSRALPTPGPEPESYVTLKVTPQTVGPKLHLGRGYASDAQSTCCDSSTVVFPAAGVSDLLAESDRRDVELAARLAAWREGFAVGAAQAEKRWQAGYVAACADVKATEHELVNRFGELAEILRRRWHLCCVPCRRGGHRPRCRDCEDRTQSTFAAPMPGDYLGGPVAWLPGRAPGSGKPPALKAVA